MIWKNILFVGCGGFIGAILRYLLSTWIQKLSHSSTFPYGTLSVNIIGCLIIGILGGLADNLKLFGPNTRMFLLVGLLGAFTTFSTFGYETLNLLRDKEIIAAFANVGIQVFVGILAVWLGYSVSKLI